jgi:uncharacterized protein (UPF0276 family)
MNKDSIRLGISGDIGKLKQFIQHRTDSNSIYHQARIRHFSLGIRPWDKIEDSLIDTCASADFTLSAHPVDINFSGTLDMSILKDLKDVLHTLPIIYIEEDIGIWRNGNLFLGAHQTNPPMTNDTLRTTAANAKVVSDHFEIPVILENPPIYSEFGNIAFWDFYLELCIRSDCMMAFDIGHYLGYCKTKDLEFDLPCATHEIWNLIKTIHISGIKTWRWNGVPVWLDQHSDHFNNDLIDTFKKTISKVRKTHNILLEMEGAPLDVEHSNISIIQKHLMQANRP